MSSNPFSPSFGTSPPVLAGRDDILDMFVEAVETGPAHPACQLADYAFLLGFRRVVPPCGFCSPGSRPAGLAGRGGLPPALGHLPAVVPGRFPLACDPGDAPMHPVAVYGDEVVEAA